MDQPQTTPVSVRTALWVCLYLLSASIVSVFFDNSDDVVLIWPPAGIAFTLLLLEGWRWWPLIALSVVLMHVLMAPVSLSFMLFSAAANTLAAVAGYFTVCWLGLPNIRVLKMRTGFLLLLGGLVVAAVSTLIGVFGLLVNSMLALSDALNGAAKWFMGDLLGLLAVTPTVLMAHRVSQRGRLADPELRFSGLTEKLAWTLTMFVSFSLMVLLAQHSPTYALGLSSLPMALLLWSALRFEPLLTASATTVLVLGGTILAGRGFAGFIPPSSLIESTILLAFMSLLAIIPQVVSAATFETRLAAMALFQRATTDRLTGLPNRTAFEERARRLIADSECIPSALVYLDLDQFKIINDTLSHAEGDQVVKQIASLLKCNLRPGEYLARLGGDEFALLLGRLDTAQALQRAEQLVKLIGDYRHASGQRVQSITASLGLVLISDDQHGYAELLSVADAACFTAKELGGNRVQMASPGARALEQRTTAMQWAVRLKDALEQEQIELFCQSIVPSRTPATNQSSESSSRVESSSRAGTTARSIHMEVLLRLRTSEGELLPSQVVHAAERFQLATRLDRYIINRCLNWFDANPHAAARIATASINLSAHSLGSEEVIQFIRERLTRSSLPAKCICFEITETSAISDLERAQNFIKQLRELGCRFALDDFGTGFCSFAYLSLLDVDYYKIDGSFVREVEHSALALSIVRAMAEIGRSLGKQTVAECVESEAIRHRVALLGVDLVQGFAVDRPMPMDRYFLLPTPSSKRGVA